MRKWRPAYRIGVVFVCAGAATIVLIWGAPAVSAAVPTCQVGAYLADLYRINTADKTVDADVWFWSLCPQPDLEPFDHLEFINASAVRQTDRVSMREGASYWTQVKFVGTFRQNLDLRDYPFDRQMVYIVVEENARELTQFGYTADTENSRYNQGIKLGDFKITGFRVKTGEQRYPTTFGNPLIHSAAGSRYAQFILEVELTRTDVSSFVKQTWPVFVSFLIALVSYLVWFPGDHAAILAARFGMLGAAVFTIVVNLRAAGESLGTFSGTTLVDKIHLFTLVYVLIAIATSTVIWRQSGRPSRERLAHYTNYSVAGVATLLYLVVTALSIRTALVG